MNPQKGTTMEPLGTCKDLLEKANTHRVNTALFVQRERLQDLWDPDWARQGSDSGCLGLVFERFKN